MKQFEYGGYHHGKPVCGALQAASAEQARHRLRDQGVSVFRMKEKRMKRRVLSKRFSVRQRAVFTRQLATLLASSVSLTDALACVAKQSDDAVSVQLALSLHEAVSAGERLSEACRRQERLLGSLFASMLEAGEASSQLDQVLLALADYTEQQADLKQTLQQAMLYPLIMTSVATLVVFFLLWRIVPMMVQALQTTHQALPWPTALLLMFSSACRDYGWIMVLLVLLCLGIRYRYRQVFHQKLLACVMHVPVVKSVVLLTYSTRFIRALSVLQAAHVPLNTALQTAALLVDWQPFRTAVRTINQRIQAGASLASALAEAPYFSPMCIQMVRCGETTGALASALEQVAAWQSQQLRVRMKRYVTVFEPVLMLTMGIVVLFIVLSVMLPIFSMDQLSGLS